MTYRSAVNIKVAVILALALSLLAGVFIACRSGETQRAKGSAQSTTKAATGTTAPQTAKRFDTTRESEIIVTFDDTTAQRKKADNDVKFRTAKSTAAQKTSAKRRSSVAAVKSNEPASVTEREQSTAAETEQSETQTRVVTDGDGFVNKWY
ncbi:MAG: hypothetical protein IJR60_03865 [Eubacterium sp.]|nr:hypothetical protein [Eubacterium sp.]